MELKACFVMVLAGRILEPVDQLPAVLLCASNNVSLAEAHVKYKCYVREMFTVSSTTKTLLMEIFDL
jgi:hypothetical protein